MITPSSSSRKNIERPGENRTVSDQFAGYRAVLEKTKRGKQCQYQVRFSA